MTPSPPAAPPAASILSPELTHYITAHTTAIVPLTDLTGVLITILGQETLIANDQPAPGYLLIFLDSPPPPLLSH